MGSISSKPELPSSNPVSEKFHAVEQENTIQKDLANLSLSENPASPDGTVTISQLKDWEANVTGDPKLRLTRTILTHTSIPDALTSDAVKTSDPHVFNLSLDFQPDPITNQKSSGRCWLFATTNVLRYSIMKKLNLKEFQLSQSYLFIYDKLEKSNYYLEMSIKNAHLPLDDRRVNHAAGDLISDGGQWDMACNLLKNYGVVPRDIFPETFSSTSSAALDKLLKTRLREHALILRRLSHSLRSDASLRDAEVLSTLRSKKEQLMSEVWTVLSTTLGSPPRPDENFVWDYEDSAGKVRSWEGTPIEFFQTFTSKQYPALESFSLIHDPRNPTSKLYTVEALGNVWEGRPVLYVNTEIDRLKAAVIKSIKAGHPVFFGSDVGQSSGRSSGVMDFRLYEYENAFNISLGLTKADRLRMEESQMTHAMVISAVHLDKSGKPVRYKVENSWGEDVGKKGYFVMTDRWFEEFVYQVVVPKQLADKDLVEVFEKGEKVVLPPWDPMGALA